MKYTPPRLHSLALLCLVALPVGAFAQTISLREQFQTSVVAYQQASTRENALKVIDLYKQLEPPPAVPETATADNARKLAELTKQLDPSPIIPETANLHAQRGAAV